MSDDNLRNADDKDNSSGNDGDRSGNAEPLIVTIEPQTKNKYSYTAKQYRLDRARYRLEKKAHGAAHWTMIFLMISTGLTMIVAVSSILATVVAKKQATLMRQQLVGTLSAIMRVVPPAWNWQKRQITIQVINEGRIAGTLKSLDGTITRENIPQKTPKDPPIPIHFSEHLIGAQNPATELLSLPYSLPEMAEADLWNLWPGKEAVIFQGQITYDDGFGDVHIDQFCFFWLPPWNLRGLKQGWGGGGWQGDNTCRIDSAINEFMALKKVITDEKAQPH